jgi:hypothetical protein
MRKTMAEASGGSYSGSRSGFHVDRTAAGREVFLMIAIAVRPRRLETIKITTPAPSFRTA